MLASLRTAVQHFRQDRRGNVAMIFAFSLIPVFGLAGGAVDLHLRSRDASGLQGAFDAASLAAARQAELGEAAVRQAARNYLDANLPNRLKGYPISIDVTNGASTVRISSPDAVRPTAFLGIIGIDNLSVNVRATATATIIRKKPLVTDLNPEAGDYNRIYVYCYDKSRASQPDKGRSQMTAIADNAGTKYTYTMPICGNNETLSYRLYNVRNARSNPLLWDTALPGTLIKNDTRDPWSSTYSLNYYSDTTTSNGVMTHNFANGVPILETVLCDTLAQCKPNSQGGIIPEGTNRTPQQATRACEPGKYMYFGWEDRPPGYGWTDSDYDDIRVIIECPDVKTTLRLVE